MKHPVLLAAVSLVLAACASGRDRAAVPGEALPAEAPPVDVAPVAAAGPAAGGPVPEVTRVVVSNVVRTSVPATRVELFGPEETGVQGNVTVFPAGEQATLHTNLYWSGGMAVFDGELRRGSCARPGERVAALEPVETNTRGGGSGRSVVPLPEGTADSLAFVYYERGSDSERPAVCGTFRTE